MNAISFSLYGTDPKYLVGALENAVQAKEFYPGWEVHFWTGEVTFNVVSQLLSSGAFVHPAPNSDIPNGMFWRFLVHDNPEITRYIIRDVDSRFSEREVRAVHEWILADTKLHVMRDHPYHNQPIMGGMWGWTKEPGDFDMFPWAKAAGQEVRFGRDQEFLYKWAWKHAKSKTIHDSCGTYDGTRNWPLNGPEFVGEYIDEHGLPNTQHREMRLKHIENTIPALASGVR